MRIAAFAKARHHVALLLLVAIRITSSESASLAAYSEPVGRNGPFELASPLSLLQVTAQLHSPPLVPPTFDAHSAEGGASPVDKRSVRSSLHDVVGDDGVLMIHLDRAQDRANNTVDVLVKAGIFPRKIPGTDAQTASDDVLDQACPLNRGPDPEAFCKSSEHRDKHSGDYRPGGGCKDKSEQAITDSHRHALLLAAERQEEWTAIFEDDAVPVRPDTWNESFLEAWHSLPATARLVRLGWCTFREPQGKRHHKPAIYKSVREPHGANFEIIDWMTWGGWGYRVGGCATAYIVHRSIIPEMLGIFPCCCIIDCCLEYGLFYRPAEHAKPGLTRGMEMMVSMDANGSTSYSESFSPLEQSGVIVQDNREVDSLRE